MRSVFGRQDNVDCVLFRYNSTKPTIFIAKRTITCVIQRISICQVPYPLPCNARLKNILYSQHEDEGYHSAILYMIWSYSKKLDGHKPRTV